MPSPRRTNFVRRGTPPRYVWVPGNDQLQTTAGATTEVSTDLISNYMSDSGRETGPGYVIERVIGLLRVVSDVTNTDVSGIPFMCGLAVTREGETSTPVIPKVEIGRFLWYLQDETPTGADEISAGVFKPKNALYQFDVHGRWRFRNMADELTLVMQNDSGEDGITWSIYTRTLLRVT